jgi:hypothetical protein
VSFPSPEKNYHRGHDVPFRKLRPRRAPFEAGNGGDYDETQRGAGSRAIASRA